MNYYYPYHTSYGFSGVFSLFFDILLIWLVVSLVWRFFSHRDDEVKTKSRQSALDIVKRRYAKGKITKKEFEEMKKDLA